ncbi:MAG TPA: hypothetical protein VK619_10790 [Pyrinomonadaceae bacterium]|nr:hypothetical protein [Pyrinomonadaceae bacterium]
MIKSTRLMRTMALSLLMMIAFSVSLPVLNSSAHSNRRAASNHGKRFRRHSRSWWRRHRAMLRRRRSTLASQTATRRRASTLSAMRNHDEGALPQVSPPAIANAVRMIEDRRASKRAQARMSNSASASQPAMSGTVRGRWNMVLPGGWTGRAQGANGAMSFRMIASDGRPEGQGALTPLALSSTSNDVISGKPRNRTLGGVSLPQLRSTVIDRMINAGGWVVNDVDREIGGHRVYIVFAQTPASEDGRTPQQNLVFYFTVLDGRIYSFETAANTEFAERVAADVERIITSITAGAGTAAAAEPPRR